MVTAFDHVLKLYFVENIRTSIWRWPLWDSKSKFHTTIFLLQSRFYFTFYSVKSKTKRWNSCVMQTPLVYHIFRSFTWASMNFVFWYSIEQSLISWILIFDYCSVGKLIIFIYKHQGFLDILHVEPTAPGRRLQTGRLQYLIALLQGSDFDTTEIFWKKCILLNHVKRLFDLIHAFSNSFTLDMSRAK